jgi:lipopolysaccharide biosynthesis regulator YciM
VIENVLIGRLFRSRGEIERAENVILKSKNLIEKIDKYLENKV